MKRILAVIAVLFAACAPEVPEMAETSGGEVEVAGAHAEAITAEPTNSCGRTMSAWQAFCRGKFGAGHGGSWLWTGAVDSSWSGNKSVGATNWHMTCVNDGADTYSPLSGGYTVVKRKCTMSNNFGVLNKYDLRCTSGSAFSGVTPQEAVAETQTAGSPSTGTRTLWAANPCN